jgi:L-ribulose-5-phosphate 3-epimerase
MTINVNRREFLLTSSVAVGSAMLGAGIGSKTAAAQASGSALKKGFCIGVLPKEMSVLDRFNLAKKVGIEGIEPNTLTTAQEVEEYKSASKETGVKILSIMNSDHWKFPLSDSDPEVVKKSVDCVKTSLKNAAELGAGAILLVPAVVASDVRYADAYTRSQKVIKQQILPMAKDLKVFVGMENVGNRFLLSPLEFARYVDDFKSPWVRAYFDIGNIVSNGWPQDWIRTLGPRLVRLHIKRFEPGTDHPKYDPADRRGQGISWPEVRKALAEVKYNGWITAEVKSGDEAYLTQLSARMDKIIAGTPPT